MASSCCCAIRWYPPPPCGIVANQRAAAPRSPAATATAKPIMTIGQARHPAVPWSLLINLDALYPPFQPMCQQIIFGPREARGDSRQGSRICGRRHSGQAHTVSLQTISISTFLRSFFKVMLAMRHGGRVREAARTTEGQS